MKAHYKTRNGRIVIEVEAGSQKGLFKAMAEVADVFESEDCGSCKSNNIVPRVRTHDGNDYYELHCRDCGACLSFGQHKSGSTLFAKRVDEEGSYLENRGWKKYSPSSQKRASGF